MSLADFQIMKRLGEGAYSSVYHVKRNQDGNIYALKKVKMVKLSDKEKENALNEVRILASINHKCICRYYEAFIDEASSSLCIVMEYANNGDLFQKITRHQKEQTYFKEEDVWRIFIQVVKGLKALHEVDIFHRDLKSANVFLNKDGTAKLGDMNVSKVAKKGLLYTQTGTPYYASPEVWRDQPYDMKSDIWSLGCVLYESVTLKPPFRADDMAGLYRKVLRGIYSKIPDHFSSELSNVIKLLIQVQASARPNCDEILEIPAVRKMGERLFKDFYDDFESGQQNQLLSTIRVPKNLLYLTDRLPKPSYDTDSHRNLKKKTESVEKRRVTEGEDEPIQSGMMPDIKKNKSTNRNERVPKSKTDHPAQHQRQQSLPALTENQQESEQPTSGNDMGTDKPTSRHAQKSNQMARNKTKRSGLQKQLVESSSQGSLQGTKQTQAIQKMHQGQHHISNLQSSQATKDVPLLIEGVNKQRQASKISETGVSKSVQPQLLQTKIIKPNIMQENEGKESDAEEYDNDDFEKEDLVQMAEPKNQGKMQGNQKSRKQAAMANLAERQTKDSSQEPAGSDSNSLLREISVRNKNETKNVSSSLPPTGGNGKLTSLKAKVQERGLNHDSSSGQLGLSPQNRGEENNSCSLPPQRDQIKNAAKVYQSYNASPTSLIPTNQPQGYRDNSVSNMQRKPRVNYPGNMAYINISSDGQRLVGPLGLKKAEQELIKRRYKYPHYQAQDTISRVALVYGQSAAALNVQNNQNPTIQSYRVNQNVNQQEGGVVPILSGAQSVIGNGYYGYNGHYNGGGITPSYYYGASQQTTNQSPYLQYSKDIQNLYRRNKNIASAIDQQIKLPRFNNQKDIPNPQSQLNQNKILPSISVANGQQQFQQNALIVGRSQQLLNNPLYQGQVNSYRPLYQQSTKNKNKNAILTGSSLEPNKMQMYLPSVQASHSQDKVFAISSLQSNQLQSELSGGNGMQIQVQPMRERPLAVNYKRKGNKLEPLNPTGAPQGTGEAQILSPSSKIKSQKLRTSLIQQQTSAQDALSGDVTSNPERL